MHKCIKSSTILGSILPLIFSPGVSGAVDKVICVPWQGDKFKFHATYSGYDHLLKCVVKTTDSSTVWYKWEYGDGTESPIQPLNGSTKRILESIHVYTGGIDTPFTAKLMVGDVDTMASAVSDKYRVQIFEDALDPKINIAIDNGLWYLYKGGSNNSPNYRTFNGSPVMVWSFSQYYASPTASAVHAFEINGHLELGDPDEDPYVEAVRHGLNWLINGYYQTTAYPMLQPKNIGNQHVIDDPDTNGNGIGIEVRDVYYRPVYEGGMVMDAIISSGTPDKDSGRDFEGSGTNHTYRQIIQDMIDQYAWGQCDYRAPNTVAGPPYQGGWRYNWNDWPDNSAAQWAAIGMIPAQESPWDCIVPQWVKEYNDNWLHYSYQDQSSLWGGFGYTGPGWSYALTPSGMVQLNFAGATTNDTRWVKTERWLADNWVTGKNWLGYDFMYAFYAFAKAMRLAQPEPVVTFSNNTFNWYRGGPSAMGLAEKISTQLVSSHVYTGRYSNSFGPYLTTAWAVIILKPVLFARSPFACFDADPNPNYPDQVINFDPSCSDHYELGKDIDNLTRFEWDFDNDGTFDYSTSTPDVVQQSFPCDPIPCTFPVHLKVTDDSDPPRTHTYVQNMEITYPPHPPVATIWSPYMLSLCEGDTLGLDGSGSYDPDEGQHEGSCPSCQNDTITAWDWDLTEAPFTFTDESGETVDLGTGWTDYFPVADVYNFGLRVTDNTALAYPSSGVGNLVDDGYGSIEVYERCLCNATGTPLCLAVELKWHDISADMYYIYRSLAGPNLGFQDISRTTGTTKIAGSFIMGRPQWYRIMAETGTSRCTSGPIEVSGPLALCNPTADPGGPYSYCIGEEVPLDGSGSTALAGTIVGWDWDLDNDGEFEDALGEYVNHTWTQNGEYTIGLRVTSSDSLVLTNEDFAIVQIGYASRCNEPPVLTLDCSVTVYEGQIAIKTGVVSDPDADSLTLTTSIGDVTGHGNGTWSWEYQAMDGPAEYDVAIRANDGNDGEDVATFKLVVKNLAPMVLVDPTTIKVNQGDTATNTGTFSDPGDDIVTLSATLGDIVGGGGGSGSWTWTLNTTASPSGSHDVTITAQDSDGASMNMTFELVVNALPVITADDDPVKVDEGEVAVNKGTVMDNDDEYVTLTASIGTIVNNEDDTWDWEHPTTDGPEDSGTVTITGDDGEGGVTTLSFELVVLNLGPSINIDQDQIEVNEGDLAENTGQCSDPGADIVDLRTSVGNISEDGLGGWSWSFLTEDGPEESQTVHIIARDSDGNETTKSFELVVNNVPPVILSLSGPVTPVNINDQPISTTCVFSDQGSNDDCSISCDWGDATTDTEAHVTSPSVANHSFTEPGQYPIEVTVTDDDGGSDSETLYVIVYDPSAGYVRGNGCILSPAGAFKFDPNSTGAVEFEVVSKYKKNEEKPKGSVNFRFLPTQSCPTTGATGSTTKTSKGTVGSASGTVSTASRSRKLVNQEEKSEAPAAAMIPMRQRQRKRMDAAMEFHCKKIHEWLLVKPERAQVHGEGTLEGGVLLNGGSDLEDCKFMITARDNDKNQTLHLKLWCNQGGAEVIVYDNGGDQIIDHGKIDVRISKKKKRYLRESEDDYLAKY